MSMSRTLVTRRGARVRRHRRIRRRRAEIRQADREADAAAWDISIAPDGKGLPAGSGTPAQGRGGLCAEMRLLPRRQGRRRRAPRLFGGIGTLKAPQQPVQTVGSYWPYATMVFDFVRRAMPWDKPKSLTNDEVYASVRLYPQPQRADEGRRRAEQGHDHEGADAQSRRLHRSVSEQILTPENRLPRERGEIAPAPLG